MPQIKEQKKDIAAWAKSAGHELLDSKEDGDVLKFWVKKG